ncbi:MAG: Histidinol-phosphate aminotransferase 2 [candidate division BRC1 bacterium ADurb.BinA364]|nr:MAG: Histidinol-phosphate aminotransferase 2 [candidate division BRC1 bacterium ADurb.BinA364]
MAQEAALAALDDTEHLRRTRELNAREKAWYEAQCERLGLEYIKSCANFISVNIGRDAKPVFEALLRQGVIVRPLAGYGMPSWLRISFGLPEENKRCMAALESILSESAKAG